MSETTFGLMGGQERSHWIRLRTLIVLRWVAIIGQATAIIAAQTQYNLQLSVLPCYFAIGVSALANLVALIVFPENKRLSEFQNFLMVLFDLLQLCFLLYMTGGLNNPFALLVLGPVTISATVMGLRSTLIIGASAIFLVSLLVPLHIPLETAEGTILRMPSLFVFGHWCALVIAILFIGAYSYRISAEIRSMSDALAATQFALSREQKLTDLGGVVAAAAHELGTPLATIKLTSSELIEELDELPELQEDARLIREQADRCRDILRSMGRTGNDDLHLRQTPLSALMHEAAEPHFDRGKDIRFSEHPADEDALHQPSILRKPEIIHGLRNLVQNAVDFAQTTVWIELHWSADHITVRICDDGNGFPGHLLGRLGDPFMRRRSTHSDRSKRPGYEGMGLGLFIAKTLLERTGARLEFANARDVRISHNLAPSQNGALVVVTWPRRKIDAISGDTPVPAGKNVPLQF
ncbi:sensor histidine kinase RegB [Tritonibacter scottomollicae]|uniref:histidine kinase n=1 Tax=Tritonibacter scottomollicae TaxID=483013 RepID=A0ABZ0HMB4_TRISK|nr:ActS/PrrB/RegB family redox-sensitive histidine kinase [Tritonibacter scottomollicae]WOI35284.1 ActS/PrrB/RegB family redox-sensitive histidine kinase [Tritonibacter scottomollicae]